MLSNTIRILVLLSACTSLAACGHDVETSSTITIQGHYALQSQKGAEAVTTPGFVSRYERQPIVTGGMENASDPCAKNFDGIMDHLEGLMAPQIAAHNEIAMRQSVTPNYRF